MENIFGHILRGAYTIQTVPRHLWIGHFQTRLERVNKKNSSVLTATYWNLHFEGAQIICPSQMFCYEVLCSILWLESFLEVFNHHCKV